MTLVLAMFTAAVVVAALALILGAVRRGGASAAEVAFGVFCGSIAVVVLRPWLGDAPAWAQVAAAVGSGATCNAYWLVARGLFGGPRAIRPAHVAVAGAVTLLLLAHRAAAAALPGSPVATAVEALLTLGSSAMVVLIPVEALRGFTAQPARERRRRAGFVAVVLASIGGTSVLTALADTVPAWAPWRQLAIAIAVLAIFALTRRLLRARRAAPVRPTVPDASPVPAAPPVTDDDRALAAAVLRALQVDRLHRQPELKVADLARHVGSAEHRVSRVITRVLGERNVQQLLNRHRIADACDLLVAHPARAILAISEQAGFASLGPFNRAFKAETGCTPSAWRARALAERHRQAAMATTAGG